LIVVKRKSLEEIISMIGPVESILIVGCDGCTGIYQEGGQKQVELMKDLLQMAIKLREKRDVSIKTAVVLRQCDRQICATSLSPLVEDGDVILSLACGVGVQTVASVFDNVVVPAHNTLFMGMQDRELGDFYEMCRGCGECILYETAGICPITRCAKGLLNGPCGGCVDGKCEVPYEVRDVKGNVIETVEKDCAWYLIYQRLKEMNRLDLFRKYRPPRDRSISVFPRRL
jgi:hypothetical protein